MLVTFNIEILFLRLNINQYDFPLINPFNLLKILEIHIDQN